MVRIFFLIFNYYVHVAQMNKGRFFGSNRLVFVVVKISVSEGVSMLLENKMRKMKKNKYYVYIFTFKIY